MKLDTHTLELTGLGDMPKRRGRPATGQAKTSAQRMADLRQRRAAELKQAKRAGRKMDDLELVKALLVRMECEDSEGAKLAWLELGRRRGWRF